MQSSGPSGLAIPGTSGGAWVGVSSRRLRNELTGKGRGLVGIQPRLIVLQPIRPQELLLPLGGQGEGALAWSLDGQFLRRAPKSPLTTPDVDSPFRDLGGSSDEIFHFLTVSTQVEHF